MKKTYFPLIHVEEVLRILGKIALFGGFNDKQLYEILKLLKTVHYAQGEVIYKRGDAPSHIYIIESGEVKIVLDAQNVSLELIAFGVGHCFGEASVIGIQPHSSSAIAVKDSELIVLERGALLSIFETDKELFGLLILNIARETARRLSKMDEDLAKYILNQ